MMRKSNSSLKSWATPLTLVTSIFVGVSGVMLFFHINYGLVIIMHELVGMLMVFALLAHVILHFKSLKRYFFQRTALLTMLIVSAISFSMVISSEPSNDPLSSMFNSIENTSLSTIAKIKKITPEQAIKELQSSGVKVENTDESIVDIANNNKVDSRVIITILFSS